jgi:antitoxin component of MazEF toxin-antitoxin module
MKTTKLRQIGGSRGILLGKSILDRIDLGDSDELRIEIVGDKIVLSPHKRPLDEFAKFFKEHPTFQADPILLDEEENEFDGKEWTW